MSRRGAALEPEEKQLLAVAILAMIADVPADELEAVQLMMTSITLKLELTDTMKELMDGVKAEAGGGDGNAAP